MNPSCVIHESFLGYTLIIKLLAVDEKCKQIVNHLLYSVLQFNSKLRAIYFITTVTTQRRFPRPVDKGCQNYHNLIMIMFNLLYNPKSLKVFFFKKAQTYLRGD